MRIFRIRSYRYVALFVFSVCVLCYAKLGFGVTGKAPASIWKRKAIPQYLVQGCPSYNYTWDSPELLKRLGESKDQPECQRENGLTLLEKGELRMNKEFRDYEKHLCEASCVYREHNFLHHLGPKCILGENSTKFTCDFIFVNCWKDNELVHVDMHMQIAEHKRDRAKEFGDLYRKTSSIHSSNHTHRHHPDVHIIVLDSAGRFSALRQLKKTYKFMTEQLNAIDFKQYTQVGFQSRENAYVSFWGIIGEKVDRTIYGGSILEANMKCLEYQDDKSYIQFEYEDAGYRTMYAEDYFLDLYGYIDCWGLKNQLATHNNRPFIFLSMLEEEVWNSKGFTKYGYKYTAEKLLKKHLRNSTKCGDQHQHVLRYAEQFLRSYKDIPKMGIIWTNEGHEDERVFHISDKYYEKFLQNNKEKLENSFVIVMGDHGQRFGKAMNTVQAPFERSNVLMLFSIPKKLRNTPFETMIRKNSDELLTNHDLHATLIDIIRHQPLSNFQDERFLKINGTLGSSWLRQLDLDLPRSCRYLPIPSELCPCNYGEPQALSRDDEIWTLLPKIVERNFNKYLAEKNLTDFCENVAIKEVTKVAQIQHGQTTVIFHTEFVTKRNAHFKASFKRIDGGEMELSPREFIRLNRYGKTANCLLTGLGLFRHVCYCKKQLIEIESKEQSDKSTALSEPK